MKNTIKSIVLCAFLLVSLSTSATAAPDEKTIFACSTAEDCIVIADDVCPGWAAVNKNEVDAYHEKWKNIHGSCFSTEMPPKPDPLCDHGQCGKNK